MYSSPTRLRMEREAGRRGNATVVVSTLLSLAVVVAAVAAVAYLVLREPATNVDSAERLEPVGTAITAPTEAPTLPTPIPTQEPAPEPAAPGFSGDAPAVSALPTAAAPEETGPTPTPRLVALPTELPTTVPMVVATVPAPVATLPPPPSEVPVVALAPVEAAPPPPPTATSRGVTAQPTPEATSVRGADPLGIFAEDDLPRIVPVGNNDAVNRVREMQDDARGRKSDRGEESPILIPTIVVPTIAARPDTGPITRKEDGSVEIVMPDVDATIAAITARTTDPNRNPNVARDDPTDAANRDDNGRREPTATAGSKKKNDRDRNRRTPTPTARPVIVPATGERDSDNGANRDNGQQGEECNNPFANLPEDQQPKNWPFDDC